MLANVVTGAIIIGIPAILLFFRTQAALVTLALYGGAMLSAAVGGKIMILVNNMIHTEAVVRSVIFAVLMFLPAIIIGLHYRKSAGGKLVFQIPNILLAGVVSLFLVIPLLGYRSQQMLTDNQVYRAVVVYDDEAVAASVILSALVCVSLYKRPKPDDKHGKHH